MIRRVITVVLLGVVVLATGGFTRACAPAPGGSGRPTVGPTFPHQPGFRRVGVTVMLRDRDHDQIRGRVHVIVNAVGEGGDRGRPAPGQHLPIDREVDSGWTFYMEVSPDYRSPILFTVTGTTIGRRGFGDTLSCAIFEDDAVLSYLAEGFDRLLPKEGERPLVAHCSGTLMPIKA
jgi:hypothetical protein